MINIPMPNIAIQKVSNGYVVQWAKLKEVRDGERTKTCTAVCITKKELLLTIDEAAKDIEDCAQPPLRSGKQYTLK